MTSRFSVFAATVLVTGTFIGCSEISSTVDSAFGSQKEEDAANILRALKNEKQIRDEYAETPSDPGQLIAHLSHFAADIASVSLNDCPDDFVIAFNDYSQSVNEVAGYTEYAIGRIREYDTGAKQFEIFVRGMFHDSGPLTEVNQLKNETFKGIYERREAMQRAFTKLKNSSIPYGITWSNE